MFKKAVEAKSHQRLSGADRKKLKRTVKDRFPNASDADIDVMLPPKVEITVAKLSNRAHVYSVEGGAPMFFDVDGRGNEIFPTVYALWEVPELLPSFTLKAGPVSHYIIGGADLMFPGIHIPPEGPPSFLAGEMWAVKVPGNSAPVAVGVTTMSSSEAQKAGMRGKALRITHCYRDSLWESAVSPYVPNEGFYDEVVLEDPALSLPSQTVNDQGEPAGDPQNNFSTSYQENSIGVSDVHPETDVAVSTHDELGKAKSEELISSMSNLNVLESSPVEEINDEPQILSPEDIDALLDRCLLQALHTTVKDKELPLAGSMLWSSHVIPCRPPGTTLDIKKSSHKKLSKWLLSKSSIGLISAKEDKHKKEVILQSVNRNHPDYTSFQPERKQTVISQQSSDSSTTGESSKKKNLLAVTELYKSSSHVNPIFASVGADTAKFYSASEATDVVCMYTPTHMERAFENKAFPPVQFLTVMNYKNDFLILMCRYVETENPVKPTNKAIVVLNATLCDALYKGAIKKGSAYPTEIHKKDLGATFLNRMQVHHCVSRGDESTVRKGAIKTVQILTERRQGNKKVTRVSGLESFLIDPEALASELQKKFACSTTVAELPGISSVALVYQFHFFVDNSYEGYISLCEFTHARLPFLPLPLVDLLVTDRPLIL